MCQQYIRHIEKDTILTMPELDDYLSSFHQSAERVVNDNSALSLFCKEKSQLAAEATDFYLRQLFRRLAMGMPQQDDAYWNLILSNLDKMEAVFIQLYKLDMGYISFLFDEFPTVVTWLFFSRSLEESDHESSRYAIALAATLDEQEWLKFANIANADNLKTNLELVVKADGKQSALCFQALESRGEMSTGFASALILTKPVTTASYAYQYLARNNNQESRDWVKENTSDTSNLFLHLLIRENRVAWLREKIRTSVGGDEENGFAQIMELPEFEIETFFDLALPMSDVHLALAGITDQTSHIINYIENSNADDDIEKWLNVLHLIYGNLLPVNPLAFGIDIEAEQLVVLLKEWWQNYEISALPRMRFGQSLSYSSTLQALSSNSIDKRLRVWLWKELCIAARFYIHYNPSLMPHRQQKMLLALKKNTIARKRFDLRNKNAVMGC